MNRMNTSPMGANKINVRRIQRDIFLCEVMSTGVLGVFCVALPSVGVMLLIRYWLPFKEALILTSDERGCGGRGEQR